MPSSLAALLVVFGFFMIGVGLVFLVEDDFTFAVIPGIIGAVLFGIGLGELIRHHHDRPSTTVQINALCRPHKGVRQLAAPYAVCLDGTLVRIKGR